MRISQENVHSRGTQSDQSPSQQRTQAPFRLTFPKSLRIRKRSHFKAISSERKRKFGKALAIDYRYAEKPQLGITAPRTFGDAHVRNQFKRRVREAFRSHQHTMPPLELVVFPKRGIAPPPFETIEKDLLTLYAQCRATKSC